MLRMDDSEYLSSADDSMTGYDGFVRDRLLSAVWRKEMDDLPREYNLLEELETPSAPSALLDKLARDAQKAWEENISLNSSLINQVVPNHQR